MKRGLIIGIVSIIILAIVLVLYVYLPRKEISKVSTKDPEEYCEPAGQSADEYSFGKYIGPKKCCKGLMKIPVKEYKDGECYDLFDVGTVCSDCGNSICEEWENQCNCPEDCNLPSRKENPDLTNCTDQGEQAAPLKPCCDGLDKIEIPLATSIEDKCYEHPSNRVSSRPQDFICSNCGNGICEDVESVCSCSEDCVGKEKSDYKSIQEFCGSSKSKVETQGCEEKYAKEMPICKLCS